MSPAPKAGKPRGDGKAGGAGKPRGGKGPAGPSHAPRQRNYWLLKTEPESYSIADLERDGVTGWDGVRNYQARNTLRDQMRIGDGVLFYHSNADPPAIAGLAEVASRSRPDPTAFDPQDHHYDPASERENPTWFLVDIRHVETFAQPLGRDTLAEVKELRQMPLLQRGSRLSVQPVTPEQFQLIVRIARAGARRA